MTSLAPSSALFVLDRWRQAWRNRPKPTVAALRSVAEDAAAVRALADTYRLSDPGFANDLYAAANRSELANEATAQR
jgi:hypothetical protein